MTLSNGGKRVGGIKEKIINIKTLQANKKLQNSKILQTKLKYRKHKQSKIDMWTEVMTMAK